MTLRGFVRTALSWLRRAAFVLVILSVVLLAGGWVFQEVMTGLQRRQFPPPGRMVAAAGHRLHLVEYGDGAPTVVLESPVGASHLAWARVTADVSRHARVISYDRAGYGWSDPAVSPRTAGAIVEDLRRMLRAGGEVGPFVFVGHSFGGLIVRLYALRHPEEVAGLVLVDPTHEAMNDRLPSARAEAESFRRMLRVFRLAARFGVLRLLDMPLGAASSEWCPPGMEHAARAVGFRSRWVDAIAAEVDALDVSLGETAEAAVRAGPQPLGDVAIVILSAGRPNAPSEAEEYEVALELHRDLLRMSSRARHRIVEGTGHFIQTERPDIVVDAIREVVDWSRAHDVVAATQG